jgi:hypothetical protein
MGDFTFVDGVGEAVCEPVLFVDGDASVAFAVFGSCPFPAGVCFVDFVVEAAEVFCI